MQKNLYRHAMLLLATTILSTAASASPSTKAEPLAAVSLGRDMGIAAVVGSDAISSYDVDNRIHFIIVTAHLSNTRDVIEKIRPQVVHSLIDEKLQLQEAQKNDIKVSQSDIDQAIEAIEQQRSMPKGAIYRILDENHVPRETFINQIRAQLSWNQLLGKKIRPQVHVSEEEIAMASRRFTPGKKNEPKTGPKTIAHGAVRDLKISLITLPVDKPGRLPEIKRLADKLVKEVRAGASFEEVSRQFSSVVANSGGKVEAFWIPLTQLDPNIARALSNATAGMVTDPLPSNQGFTIIKVYDVRSANAKQATPVQEAEEEDKPKAVTVTLKEILLRIKPDAENKEADMMLKVGEDVAKNPGTCEEKGVANIKNFDEFDIEVNFRTQLLSDLPPALKIIAENLKTGDISTPFASREGIRLYMLCNKKEVEIVPADHEEIYRMLTQQKMELEAQKYIRNLRREVFIDIR